MIFILDMELYQLYSTSSGCMGVGATNPHVLCGLGGGIRPCEGPVGGSTEKS